MNDHTNVGQRGAAKVARAARSLVAVGMLAAAAAAQAVVGTPGTTSSYGAIFETPYGPTALGLIYELRPLAFIEGLGLPGDATDVITRTPLLEFVSPIYSGFGTDLATIEYRIRNVSATQTFSNVRFMVFANPDGGPDPYLDQVLSVVGASAGGPSAWEARAITETQALADSLTNRFAAARSLTTGVDAACSAVGGCDAEMGLQWNAALAPGESLVVQVGLSDSGKTLSATYLSALSRTDPGTQLIFSGRSQVLPAAVVPEPQGWAMLLAGLGVVGLRWRKKAD